jgi:transglutaminase/protease-like cytokinesis protein 3
MKISALLLLISLNCSSMVRAQIADFCDTDFSKADSIADLHTAHPLKDLKGLADKLTAPLSTDHEKFRAIYKWVCSNIEGDYNLVTLNKRKRARLSGSNLTRWNERFSSMVFETLVHEQKTICTGYAYLIRELSVHAGLYCVMVNGHAKPGGLQATGSRNVNHSWNLVQLNDKWYVCDATWSSGVFNRSTGQFTKKFNDKYFLTDPAVFSLDHDTTITTEMQQRSGQ